MSTKTAPDIEELLNAIEDEALNLRDLADKLLAAPGGGVFTEPVWSTRQGLLESADAIDAAIADLRRSEETHQ